MSLTYSFEIVCITTAPVFFCAAIYVLLAKTQVIISPHLFIAKEIGLTWVYSTTES